MYALEMIKHSEASPVVIERVIALKQKAWPYPICS